MRAVRAACCTHARHGGPGIPANRAHALPCTAKPWSGEPPCARMHVAVTAPQQRHAPSAQGSAPSLLHTQLKRYFNIIQSECFDTIYGSDTAVVVAAPTGSGKTGAPLLQSSPGASDLHRSAWPGTRTTDAHACARRLSSPPASDAPRAFPHHTSHRHHGAGADAAVGAAAGRCRRAGATDGAMQGRLPRAHQVRSSVWLAAIRLSGWQRRPAAGCIGSKRR